MPRAHFQQELEKLELDLLTMGELAGNAVGSAVGALLEHDDAKAEAVIAGDDAIDALHLDLEERCMRLLALQQPMASDLRCLPRPSGSRSRRSTRPARW